MRIGIMAAGAVGAYFGARLQAAGHAVVFFARGANLEALRRDGLKIESPLGDLHLKSVTATDDPAGQKPVDFVLFAVKLWDTADAGRRIKPIVGPDTRVISLQNGIDSVDILKPILGDDVVVGGSAYIASVIASPGVIKHSSQFAHFHCGRLDGKPDPKLQALADAAEAAGIKGVKVSDQMLRDLWQKFAFLVSLSSATGSTRQPLGPILADPETAKFFDDLLVEVVTIGRAKKVPIADDFLEKQRAFSKSLPPGLKASLLHDLERGNRLELDWLAGRVVALGKELGIPTPANQAAYTVMKLSRMGKQ
jgi:2-dehydropantoate 2-reductase